MEEPGCREDYILQQKRDLHKVIVNYKSSETPCTSSMIWTYRTTGCDIISIVTTTSALKTGAMKDINVYSKDIKRLKAPSKKHGVLIDNPLGDSIVPDVSENRKKLNESLKAEKSAFLAKLMLSRRLRGKAESVAAIAIQTCFRKHYVLRCSKNIKDSTVLQKQIRAELRSLQFFSNELSFTPREHRVQYSAQRGAAAAIVQRSYRCYISRKTLRSRRREHSYYIRRKAATRMQSAVRQFTSKVKVRKLLMRSRHRKRAKACSLIQNVFRMHLAKIRVRLRRYKFHWVCCRFIQKFFRKVVAKHRVRHMLYMKKSKQYNAGAKLIQGRARGYMCRRLDRTNRIRQRRDFLFRFKGASQFQRIIRGYLSRHRVQRMQLTRTQLRLEEFESAEAARDASEKVMAKKEADLLAESMNILLQAKRGNTTIVGDLISAAAETATPDTNDALNAYDDQGNNVLIIAAIEGHLDLVRKCIIWGFDCEYRNAAHETALMLAVKHHRIEVVSYLLHVLSIGELIEVSTMESADEEGAEAPVVVRSATEILAEELANELAGDEAIAGEGVAAAGSDSAAEGVEEVEAVEVLPLEPQMRMLPNDDTAYIYLAVMKHVTKYGLELLTILINHHLDVTAKHSDTGLCALHGVCESGDVEAFKLVMKQKGAIDDVTAMDEMGQTPLHKACGSNLLLVKTLLGTDCIDLGVSCITEEMLSGISMASPVGSQVVVLDTMAGSPSKTPEAATEEVLSKVPSVGSLPPGDKVTDLVLDVNDNDSQLNSPLPSVDTKELYIKAQISKQDIDGKDGFLIAGLSGKEDILNYLSSLMNQDGVIGNVDDDRDIEIGWSPNDITRVLSLVEEGNVACLEYVLNAGFDVSWQSEKTGCTAMMCACECGHMDVIELLLSKECDCRAVDSLKRNCFHYASRCPTVSEIVPFLLSHDKAGNCSLSNELLVVQDQFGWTPVHIATSLCLSMSLTVLSQINKQDGLSLCEFNDCMNPLLVACSVGFEAGIETILFLGGNSSAVDQQGRNAIWHLLHPAAIYALPDNTDGCNLVKDVLSLRRTRRVERIHGGAPTASIIVKLLEAGCSLFCGALKLSDFDVDCDFRAKAREAQSAQQPLSAARPSKDNRPDMEEEAVVLATTPGRPRLQFSGCESAELVIKSMHNEVLVALADCNQLSSVDCWRIALLCMQLCFDDTCSALFSFINAHTLRKLSAVPDALKQATATSDISDVLGSSSGEGYSLLGWAIRYRNLGAIGKLLQLVYARETGAAATDAIAESESEVRSTPTPLVVDSYGHTCFHLAAKYDYYEVIGLLAEFYNKKDVANGMSDALLHDSEEMKVSVSYFHHQMVNNNGETAGMLAAKHGNFNTLMKLLALGVDARSALQGRYCSWILARARLNEAREMNLECGNVDHDDDNLYFSVYPDPHYIVWYDDKPIMK